MDDQLWRLVWAFPLVVVLGVGAIYWLKRMGLGDGTVAASACPEPVVVSDMALTERSRVLVVSIGEHRFAVFESSSPLVVETLNEHRERAPSTLPQGGGFMQPWFLPGRKSSR